MLDWRVCVTGEFGAQASRGISEMNRGYRCVRGDYVPLSGLTDRNSDHPGTWNLRFRHMLGEMPELILLDSGIDPGWNCCILASTDQECNTGGCCRVGLMN